MSGLYKDQRQNHDDEHRLCSHPYDGRFEDSKIVIGNVERKCRIAEMKSLGKKGAFVAVQFIYCSLYVLADVARKGQHSK